MGMNINYLFGNIVLSEQQSKRLLIGRCMHEHFMPLFGIQYHHALNHDLSYIRSYLWLSAKLDITNAKYIVNGNAHERRNKEVKTKFASIFWHRRISAM